MASDLFSTYPPRVAAPVETGGLSNECIVRVLVTALPYFSPFRCRQLPRRLRR